MIKFAIRRNLKYPLQLLISNILRDADNYLIRYLLDFNNTSCFIILMFFGEFLGGLIFYIKEYKFLSKNKKENPIQFINIGFYKSNQNLPKDKISKRIFLIFISSFFDFVPFLITVAIFKYTNKSITFEQRFRGILTIYTTYITRCFLKLNIKKHQNFSIIIILCLLNILVISETLYQETNIFSPPADLLWIFIVLIGVHLFCAIKNVIEKYLFEYNQTSPYLLLMFEGIFGLILTIIYYIFYSPFAEIIRFYKQKSTIEFIFLIIFFILYILLSASKSLFRVLTTKIFDPITATFMDYILNPFNIIYLFVSGQDFISN